MTATFSNPACKSGPARASNPSDEPVGRVGPTKEAGLDDEADIALVRRLSRGDEAAFDVLIERHHDRVTRLASRLLGWSGPVDDVVQEVFLSAWRHLPKFRGEASIATWLTRVTANQCRTHARRQRVRRRWWRNARAEAESASTSAPPADEPAVRDETAAQVRAAIDALPQRDREVIVLHYLEAMSPKTIADTLGRRVNTIEVRLHRARRKLKAQLNGVLGTEDDER